MIPQAQAHEVLSLVQTVSPSAHVAGGAVRDWFAGREVKDIDVFYPAVEYAAVTTVVEGLYPALTQSITEEYFEHEPSVAIAEMREAEGRLPVNLIGLHGSLSMMENLERFDFGICRIGYDGASVIRHPDFEHDYLKQVFTLRRCQNVQQFARSMDRYKRLSAKYPGWPLDFPDTRFEEYTTAYQAYLKGEADLAELFA